jgi:hypothetical protein
MAAKVVTLDGLDLNDKVLYWRMPGFSPGESEPSYDEQVSYAGGVAVTNVQAAHVVQLTLPIDVRASSEAAMLAGVGAINAKIAACHFATPKTLVVGSRSFQIIDSKQVVPAEDDLYQLNVARLAIVLNRLP